MGEGLAGWLGPAEWQAVRLSLRVAFWATLASLPFGILVAYALARWSFPGRPLLNGIVHLPLVLPPVVTGYLLLVTFGRRGTVGQFLDEWFGIVLSFRWTGAAVAAAVMAFPLMVRAIRLAIEAVDPKLEAAASTLGASRPWVFGQTQTIPSAIYAFLQVPGGQEAAQRLVLVAVVIAMAALFLSEFVGRRVARMVAGS
jgi:molybdate transport system permease protein